MARHEYYTQKELQGNSVKNTEGTGRKGGPVPIICLMGPTGVGKTQLATWLVQEYPFEIISVDSAMVYRGMDIGTAKPTKEELKITPHRLIDIRDPAEPYSAADFRRDAICEIQTIFSQNKIPLLVGGTMLYFKALQEGLSDLPAANPKIREKINNEAKQKGWPALHEKLKQIDPESAKRISENDSQRIQRALELFELTNKTPTQLYQENKPQDLPYEIINIAIMPTSREQLHQNIEKRFDKMLKKGFIDEVKQLKSRKDLHRDLPSMRAVGYRQVWDYLDGQYDEKTMREKAIIATRQLAKRQLTWLRSWSNVYEIAKEDKKAIIKILQWVVR